MADQIPSGITRNDVLQGINAFKEGAPHQFKDSTRYDLLHEHEKFPPKAILGLAAVRLNGKPLVPRDFSGGEDSKCFKILRELGFRIVPKAEGAPVWFLQGNPKYFDIDTYLAKNSYVYWSVPIKKYQHQMNIGDQIYFWRAAGDVKGTAGVIGMGVVAEPCKPIKFVDHPDLIDPGISTDKGSLWSENSEPKTDMKVGVKVHEVRLSTDDGMLGREDLLNDPILSKLRIITVGSGSVFGIKLEEHAQLTSLWNGVKEAISSGEFTEGTVRKVISLRYERDPRAKHQCLKHYGFDCQVCGMNFQERYGAIGKDFIHVHHVWPVSKRRGSYKVDPIKDLVPLCPNCHSMAHKRENPFTVEELKEMLRQKAFSAALS